MQQVNTDKIGEFLNSQKQTGENANELCTCGHKRADHSKENYNCMSCHVCFCFCDLQKQKTKEKNQKRAEAMVKMGLVGKETDGERWEVKTPSLRGHQRSFYVNTTKPTSACTCLDYEYADERDFFCEHKWAVRYFQERGA